MTTIGTERVWAPPPPRPRKQPLAPAQLLERLTGIGSDERQVVSCYVRVGLEDRPRGKFLIELKTRVKALEETLPALVRERATRLAVERDLARVVDYLKSPGHLPPTLGLAIFASEPLGLFEVVHLPRVYRSRLAVDRTPLIRELAALEEEFGRVLTAVVDRARARIFEVTAFAATEVTGPWTASTRGGRFHSDRGDSPGQGEQTFHNRIEEEKHRHCEAVARHLLALDRRQPARGVVVAGLGADAEAVGRFLHPTLAERLMGTAQLNPKGLRPAAVYAATLGVHEAYERSLERALVSAMEAALGVGWAVNGARPTLGALARGQVRTLLVNAAATGGGFRCADGRLVLSKQECRREEAVPVVDLVDEAIEEALRQGVAINVVHDSKVAAGIDGLAALLRFR